MDLVASISKISSGLDSAGVNYAVIGGMAMAMRGVQRATFDLDFLLMLSDLSAAQVALEQEGYTRVYHSENVSHFEKTGASLFRVDILHAFRGPSLSMLKRAERLPLNENCSLPVLQIEDIIGLKIQAQTNDPRRSLGDWNDIYRLIQYSAEKGCSLDWDRVFDYLEIFHLESKLPELKKLYEDHL